MLGPTARQDTCLNCDQFLSAAGHIRFNDRDITRRPCAIDAGHHPLAISAVFPALTVMENGASAAAPLESFTSDSERSLSRLNDRPWRGRRDLTEFADE